MERSIRLLTTLFAVGALTACAIGPREGPPAPVVRATPRPPAPQVRTQPERVPESAPETPKPVDRGVRVYAYKDPSQVQEPVSEPAVSTADAPDQTRRSPAPAGPAPSAPPERPVASRTSEQALQPSSTGSERGGPAAPQAPSPAEQTVAKAEPRQQLPQTAAPAPPPEPEPVVSQLPESTVVTPDLPPAAETLARQAERQRQAGDYAGAAASLERSLRIAPREPYLWNRLARVRMEQGQSVQAGNLASRANDLAGENPDVKKDNWRIIAESKRRAGDMAGASEAEKRAGQD